MTTLPAVVSNSTDPGGGVGWAIGIAIWFSPGVNLAG